MTSRGRAGSTTDWDDFNDNTCSMQYGLEDTNEDLDYKKLYVTKFPAALAKQGLLDLFSKYGRVVHHFVSKDPTKKYAFVTYETTGEARVAMMKLNKTEPFCMNIVFSNNTNNNRNKTASASPIVKSQANSDRLSNQQYSKNLHSVDRPSDRHQSVSNLDRHHSPMGRQSVERQHSQISQHSHMDRPYVDRQHSHTDRQSDDRQHSHIDRQSVDRQHSHTDRHPERRMDSQHRIRDDSSMSSKIRGNMEQHINGDEGEETEESDGNDPKLEYDLEKLKLQRLRIMDEQLQVQQRLLIQQQRMKSNNTSGVTKKRVSNGRSIQFVADETSLTVGAGDSSDASRRCVSCGARAGLFCAGCRVTPYCGEVCQRRDWRDRHHDVCHNLARGTEPESLTSADIMHRPHQNGNITKEVPVQQVVRIPPAQAISAYQYAKQRKVNPASNSQDLTQNQEPRHQGRQQESPPPPPRDQYQEQRQNKDLNGYQQRRNQDQNRGQDLNGYQQRRNQDQNHGQDLNGNQQRRNQDQNRGQDLNGDQQRRKDDQNRSQGTADLSNNQSVQDRFAQQRLQIRQPRLDKPTDTKAAPKLVTAKTEDIPAAKPEPTKLGNTSTKSGAENDPKRLVESVSSVTPRKPLLPASFAVHKLAAGETFIAAVKSPASGQAGHVCLTLHPQLQAVYDQLIDEFAAQCEADALRYLPRLGENFAYFRKEDEGWYRARCLSPTRAALIDEGSVVSFEEKDCRKMPSDYANIPEFIAVIKLDKVKIDASLICSIVSVSAHAVKVTVTDEGGASLGETEAVRWVTVVEYPQDVIQPTEQINKTIEPVKKPQLLKVTDPVKTVTPVNIPKAETKIVEVIPRPVVDRKPLVPDSYIIDKLSVGDEFIASVSSFSESLQAFMCETVHESYNVQYQRLCEDFLLQCEADTVHHTPSIGETFAYLDEEGWFRARCLACTRAALVDAGRVVSFKPSECRKLPSGYEDMPEFLAVIKADKIQVNTQICCLIVSTSPKEAKVRLSSDGTDLGEGTVQRWMPNIEYPVETPTATAPTPAAIPTLERPLLEHNAVYVLLDASTQARACVRPADAAAQEAFHAAIHDTATVGLTAKPLTEPPQRGQTVIAKFEDGNFYRAFVKRINVSKNKYLIEYVEYGNEEVTTLERLYACPGKLSVSSRPVIASFVRLSPREDALSAPAAAFIEHLKDHAVELILTIPGGEKHAPSGSLVNLVIAKNCAPVSKKIEELCTPPWKRLLERGGDVLETECREYKNTPETELPISDSPLSLTIPWCTAEGLITGTISAHLKDADSAARVFGELALQINEYAESALCKDPYLPKLEELCIVRHKKDNKWARAVLAALPQGAGSALADVIFLDYGNIETVPTSGIRKLMPEFLDDYPVATHHFEIKDFPNTPLSQAQLDRAMRYLQQTATCGGSLSARVNELGERMYEVDAPGLIEALSL